MEIAAGAKEQRFAAGRGAVDIRIPGALRKKRYRDREDQEHGRGRAAGGEPRRTGERGGSGARRAGGERREDGKRRGGGHR